MPDKFEEFVEIVKRLRVECPWDRKQTHESIRQNLIEEAYEVIEAIDTKNYGELRGELGDVLLHVVFHSVLAEEVNRFNISDVIDSISEKLIHRHPHVFGDVTVNDHEEVKTNWERLKVNEGRKSFLDGIPDSLPALSKAFRLQEKASRVGFDWGNKSDCWEKVTEELDEFYKVSEELSNSKPDNGEKMKRVGEEFGDLLFSLVNYARFLKVNPEDALRSANRKFAHRFRKIEEELKNRGKTPDESSLEEMDKIWDDIKRKERKENRI